MLKATELHTSSDLYGVQINSQRRQTKLLMQPVLSDQVGYLYQTREANSKGGN